MSEPCVLLLSDVVDSTQLTERLGIEDLSAWWETHDRAARGLLRQWRGREIDKSDGFLLLFDRVADAVGFALAYHHALAQLTPPLKARVGVHAGPVLLRENPADDVALGAKPVELEGPAKPLAARVMGLALGGQTLLSDSARAALGETGLRVHSHGHWRLKGLAAPIELFEVGEVGDSQAPFTPPPDAAKAYRVLRQGELWLPLREVRHTLPAERDSFVGREPALQELAQHFDSGARLVSLLGIGGAGKTRLAQRFGWAWLGDFAGGVWFCDLSQATSLDGIVHAVAQGLELPLGKADPVQQIGQAMAGRGPCLVILDNFEQVARHAEATLGRWLDRAAEARFLVTTREVLGIVGEHAMVLAPLPVPDSVALFMRRALAATRSFHPVGDEAAAVEPLVKLLDGLPLAIELCAARVRVMPPRQLLQRMSERFKLLTSSGGRHDRQATLRATLDWSWDLLSEPERSALAQLSVFEGGFTLASAEAVIDLSAFHEAPWVVDVVQSLVQKSLVRQVSDKRFELLRTVQDYAATHLARLAEQGTAACQASWKRHWQHFAALDAKDVSATALDAENLVAACRRATAHGDGANAVAVLIHVAGPLRLTGPFGVLLEMASQVALLERIPASHRAAACRVAGHACFLMGQFGRAGKFYADGLEFARAANDPLQQAELLHHQGELEHAKGQLDLARADLALALKLGLAEKDLSIQYRALNAMGAVASDQSQWREARQHYDAALQLALKVGDARWTGGLHGNLGALCHEEGRIEEAECHYVEALRLTVQTGDRLWAANTSCNLGLLMHERGRFDAARERFEGALAAARELGHLALEFTVLCNLGLVCEAQGLGLPASQHFDAAIRLSESVGDLRAAARFRIYQGRLHGRLGNFVAAQDCLARSAQVLRDADDQLGLGLLHCAEAELALHAGLPSEAAAHIGAAQSIADEAGLMQNSELGKELALVRELAADGQKVSSCS